MNLGPPQAETDEQESPIAEKFWRFPFKSVADELENPSQKKKGESVGPQAMEEDACKKNWKREQDGWDAEGVADAIYRVLMAGSVLRDPLLVGGVAQHPEDDTTERVRLSADSRMLS